MEPQEKPTEFNLTILGSCPGHDLHHHRFDYRQLAVMSDELCQPLINGSSGGSVEFDQG